MTEPPQRLWTSRRAVLLHLTVLIVAPGCLAAAWWQANRALSGNALSYVYSIEWPVFAGYAVFMWWKILHESPETRAARTIPAAEDRSRLDGTGESAGATGGTPSSTAPVESVADGPAPAGVNQDPDRAEYNAYLAALAGRGPKTWRGETLPYDVTGRAVRK